MVLESRNAVRRVDEVLRQVVVAHRPVRPASRWPCVTITNRFSDLHGDDRYCPSSPTFELTEIRMPKLAWFREHYLAAPGR